MNEIIKGILAEMREFIKNPTIGTKTECEVKLEKYLKGCMKDYADRIEVVVAKMETTTPTCKDSLQVGNAAKMREALEQVAYIVRMFDDIDNVRSRVKQVMTAVLTTPPRNCDKCLTPKDAMLAHLEEVYEGEKVEFGDYEWCEFVKWLFAEAKGETK